MVVYDVIKEISEKYRDITKTNIYYYADIADYPDEFVGVATYHDGFLDTSEDPDGWTLKDTVEWYREYDRTEDDIRNNEISLHVNLGKWDT